MHVGEYGIGEPVVVVLHGGPGAPGTMALVAQGLSDSFRVLEPLQRGSGNEPLTVARHVADLHELLESRCGGGRPALVGHSWGAMLALAYAAAHPARVAALVLIGCGTFDRASRDRMAALREERTTDILRRRIEGLADEFPDPDERLRAMGSLLLPLYSYDPIESHLEVNSERQGGEGTEPRPARVGVNSERQGGEGTEPRPARVGVNVCDARAHRETWEDMVRLQEEGVYPTAFAAIDVPVVMLHGAVDPHPGRLIRASLAPHLPQLEYRELERCGHYPWLEKSARDEFFAVLRGWLDQHLAERSTAADEGGGERPS